MNVEAGDGQVVITLDFADRGDVTGYRILVTPSSKVVWKSPNRNVITIKRLENGTEYRFQLAALSRNGLSGSTITRAVTPGTSEIVALPSPPATSVPESAEVESDLTPTVTLESDVTAEATVTTSTETATAEPEPTITSTPAPTATSVPLPTRTPRPATATPTRPTATPRSVNGATVTPGPTATATPASPVQPTLFVAIDPNLPSVGMTADGLIFDYTGFNPSSSEE